MMLVEGGEGEDVGGLVEFGQLFVGVVAREDDIASDVLSLSAYALSLFISSLCPLPEIMNFAVGNCLDNIRHGFDERKQSLPGIQDGRQIQ